MKNFIIQIIIFIISIISVIAQNNGINTDLMDKSVKPQDHFYNYTNRTWMKTAEIPSHKTYWGSFNELDQANKTKLTIILEDAKNANDIKGSDKHKKKIIIFK